MASNLDRYPTQTHRWRILLRTIGKTTFNQQPYFLFVIPGYPLDTTFIVSAAIIPQEIADQLEKGVRLFARANIGAGNPKDIVFSDFELPRLQEV